MGKIKLKLPGSRKDPNTAAEVELPIDMPGMSPTLIEGLNRGVRLQARKNVRANSFKRDPPVSYTHLTLPTTPYV